MREAPTDPISTVEFWFEFASTYSYPAAMRIDAAADAAGVRVSWQPFLLGPVFRKQGWNTSPFNLYPAKGRYMWRDLQRRCAALGLPLTPPEPGRFPQHSVLAARMALVALGGPQGPAFCRSVFHAGFGEGADISDPITLDRLAAAAGLAELRSTAQTEPVKARLRAQVDRAEALGLFGAPSFVVGDEVFWGEDRLDAALAWAKGERPPGLD